MKEKNLIESALYIVPTPIGNLDDISLRAIKVLKEVDIVACEDTRRAGQLMKFLNIAGKKFISYHEHNERGKSVQIAEYINQNKSVALISDAGTPGISDPAYRLINECIKKDLKIFPLPGATAFVPALLASALAQIDLFFLVFRHTKKAGKLLSMI